jgi:hypothetical protein
MALALAPRLLQEYPFSRQSVPQLLHVHTTDRSGRSCNSGTGASIIGTHNRIHLHDRPSFFYPRSHDPMGLACHLLLCVPVMGPKPVDARRTRARTSCSAPVLSESSDGQRNKVQKGRWDADAYVLDSSFVRPTIALTVPCLPTFEEGVCKTACTQ